jgi:hypothetical protein
MYFGHARTWQLLTRGWYSRTRRKHFGASPGIESDATLSTVYLPRRSGGISAAQFSWKSALRFIGSNGIRQSATKGVLPGRCTRLGLCYRARRIAAAVMPCLGSAHRARLTRQRMGPPCSHRIGCRTTSRSGSPSPASSTTGFAAASGSGFASPGTLAPVNRLALPAVACFRRAGLFLSWPRTVLGRMCSRPALSWHTSQGGLSSRSPLSPSLSNSYE